MWNSCVTKNHAWIIMHVQTIPKSPPKIIVQVAKVVTFFLTKMGENQVNS